MDEAALLEALKAAMPVNAVPYATSGNCGLILVDVVDGFCTPGKGNLAPPPGERPAPIAKMVRVSAALARQFADGGRSVLAFMDTHEPGVAEPPYPPHCERGTGEELLVKELSWLPDHLFGMAVEKDCINGFIGLSERQGSRNILVEWINRMKIETIVVCGICTDICTSDFVTTLLSARNHRTDGNRPLMPTLRDVVVHETGNATYDLPRQVAEQIGLPATAAHPAALAHHIGLWTMQSRGAIIASSVDGI